MPEESPLNLNDPEHVDEVLEELWRIRAEMAAEWNHDLSAAVAYFEEQRRLHPIEGLIDSLPKSA